jgi:hypothetical protein
VYAGAHVFAQAAAFDQSSLLHNWNRSNIPARTSTTARFLNVTDDYLQEPTERKPLTLVQW